MAIKMLLCGSALAISAALSMPSAATAQVTGLIASASPTDTIFSSKAWAAANNLILTTYKTQLDQKKALEAQIQTQLVQLDKNGDKQVDDAELQAAMTANSPAVAQINTLNQQVQPISQQLLMAQAFALDTISQRYETSLQKIVTDRKIGAVLAPDAIVWAPPTINITQAVTAELDRVLPTTSVTPPPNWQVTQAAAGLMQQLQQMQEVAQQQAQQRAAAAALNPPPAGAAPVAPAAGRAPAAPARGSTQQPAAR